LAANPSPLSQFTCDPSARSHAAEKLSYKLQTFQNKFLGITNKVGNVNLSENFKRVDRHVINRIILMDYKARYV
jgi:hypothetical protein